MDNGMSHKSRPGMMIECQTAGIIAPRQTGEYVHGILSYGDLRRNPGKIAAASLSIIHKRVPGFLGLDIDGVPAAETLW